MTLKSILKKASIALGSTLLAFNIGCNSLTSHPQNFQERQSSTSSEQENLEAKIKNPVKIRKWQYSANIPANIFGGYLTHIYIHESGHAVTGLAMGVEIKEFRPYPGVIKYDDGHTDFHGGWVRYTKESYDKLSNQEKALTSIAGPAADIALAEIINYNLRKGNISPECQPFWATTSLMARCGPIWIAIKSLGDNKMNDFYHFEKMAEIPKEIPIGLVALYTALNAKRIKKELNVALGKDTYPINGSNSRVDLVPNQNGLGVSYTLNF